MIKYYQPIQKSIEDLSPEEWKNREAEKHLTPAKCNVLQYFLFGCYAGLRFQDVKDIEYKHIKSKLVEKTDSSKFVKKHYVELYMHKSILRNGFCQS